MPCEAVGNVEVVACPQVDRLVDRAALPEGVEVAHLDDLARRRDAVVRRNGDIVGWNSVAPIKESKCDAAALVDRRHDEGRGGDKLELELRPAGCRSSRVGGAFGLFEYDAFGSVPPKFLERRALLFGINGNVDGTDSSVESRSRTRPTYRSMYDL